MSTYDSMIGQEYGRWTVLARDLKRKEGRGFPYLVCVCSCGEKASVYVTSLRSGRSSSCGCHRIEIQRELHTIHGHADLRNGLVSSAYRRWTNMKTRCYNPNSEDYHNYGGRGIRVCDRWRKSFAAFYKDVGDPPRAGLTLDRERVDGDYEPGNVRWATAKQQANNRRPRKV